ncbi:diacylglycerol kinase family protein [Bosea sp. 117]|uniref:diacylglycerol/lipid kinase family protein n=1 Tax=Bosea sp. 117 TaxID=1125973 RepID=UPI000493DC86|nr:diacylglycerol kinase family protein [Bosea sp. 117]
MRHALVLVNAEAGTVLDLGGEQVRAMIERDLGAEARRIDMRLLKGAELGRAIEEAGRGPHDTVVIGGGDGSVSLAARTLARSGKTLGILPLGTINLLARDIGMPLDLDRAVAALAVSEPRKVDLATINGRRFHTISGMGFFSQMARARETARRWRLWRFLAVAIAAVLALRRTGRVSLDIDIDGARHSFEAFAALVTVNRFDGPGWRRARLDDGVLEIHIAEDRGALAKLRAGADMVTDNWRGNPGIISLTGRRIILNRPSRRRIWISTDGELSREDLPVSYAVEPGALSLLMPPADFA